MSKTIHYLVKHIYVTKYKYKRIIKSNLGEWLPTGLGRCWKRNWE